MPTARRLFRRTATLILLTASLAIASVTPVQASATSIEGRAWPANVRWGSAGPGVTCLQRALNVVHRVVPQYVPLRLAADGRFGRLTDHDVRAFQWWFGLRADGVVGPKTRAALAYALERPAFASYTTSRLRRTDCVRTGRGF